MIRAPDELMGILSDFSINEEYDVSRFVPCLRLNCSRKL